MLHIYDNICGSCRPKICLLDDGEETREYGICEWWWEWGALDND
jgi:hypothetical protein